jgi:hypothetical protein
MATTLDFTTHCVVVGSLGTAASLSAIGFVVSPFVYFGHEMARDIIDLGRATSIH